MGGKHRDLLVVCSEHESAHCVVARALGVQVASIEVIRRGFGGGRCSYLTTPAPAIAAAVAAAGDLWDREFSIYGYEDRSCGDLRKQVRLVGVQGIWAGRERARRILVEHQARVRRLAEKVRQQPGHVLPR